MSLSKQRIKGDHHRDGDGHWTKTMNENLGSLRSSAKTQQSQTPCTMLHSLQLTDPTMLHRSLSQTPRTVFKTAGIEIYLDTV